MRTTHFRLSMLVGLSSSLVLGAAAATAQVGVPSNTARPSNTPSRQDNPAAVSGAGGVVTFAEEKFRLDSVGLAMSLPEGASVQSTTMANRAVVQVLPKEANWAINIQTPRTSNPEATIVEAADKTIATLQGSVGVVDPDQTVVLETQAKLLERKDDLSLAGGPASRLYISVPNTDGTRIVKGYTIFKPTPAQYVVFELTAAEKDFSKVRGVYEAIMATASFADSEAVMAERGAFVKAGQAFVNGLTEADYITAMGSEKSWFRCFKAASTGAASDAEELGYRGIRFWRGQRGEIDPSKPKNKYSKTEQEDGYLCSIEGRQVIEGQIIDSRGIFYMKPDRTEETWSLIVVRPDPDGRDPEVASETGARTGTSLTVVTKAKGRPVETVQPPVPEGYISQFESWLMPRLIVRKGVQSTLGFYHWERSSVGYRKDIVSKGGPRHSPWTITTSYRDEDARQVYSYSDNGELVRGDLPGDRGAWEPMDPSAIVRLWERKGLPTGKLLSDGR